MVFLAAIVAGVVIFVSKPANNISGTKSQKTIYDTLQTDDERLRAEPEPKVAEKPAIKQNKQVSPSQPPEEPEEQQPAPRQFKKLPEIERIQAERLFEMAITHRKVGRLPGTSYKQMVDYCRQIIQKYPGTVYEYKAKRMLADIPDRYRARYKIKTDEINYDN